jgi:hypothetical protein
MFLSGTLEKNCNIVAEIGCHSRESSMAIPAITNQVPDFLSIFDKNLDESDSLGAPPPPPYRKLGFRSFP